MKRFPKYVQWPFLAILSLGFVVALSACSKKEVKEDEPLINPSGDTSGGTAPGGSSVDSGSGGLGDSADSGDLKTVYFDFDSYRINGSGRSAMRANADWLKKNSSATVQIEGHCDERGTTQYNLALGERRANATRDYMAKLGVEKSRLSVISYGKERPSDPGHDESAWSKNRRSQFVILSK